MSILDDTVIFATIVSYGSFTKAAQKLNISNGLVSRRLSTLEKELGVTLLKRTTRQIKLTPEGEIFWQHARRIQQELDAALCTIRSASDKPKGLIRISAPPHLGRHFMMKIINDFMADFEDISIDLILSGEMLDPIKDNLDLIIRGTGYIEHQLKDSSMKTRLLVKLKNRLYASQEYLVKKGVPQTPEDLLQHRILGFPKAERSSTEENWIYWLHNKEHAVTVNPTFNCSDADCRIDACFAGHGIIKFCDLLYLDRDKEKKLQTVLTDYDWGEMSLYAIYSQQQALPKRTRLLLDFIVAHGSHLKDVIAAG